jgi:exonuclease III
VVAEKQLRLATLNINGVTAPTRIGMLTEFLRKQDIVVMFVQEVTDLVLDMWGYKAYTNLGTTRRGTAFIARKKLELKKIKCLPSGRGFAATFNGVSLMNIYAPSGAEKRREMEDFYALVLPYLMRTIPSRMILGGDFNCMLTQTDCTWKGNYSRALQQLVRGYDLVDVWEAKPTRDVYTHYRRQGATRIDRLYITRNI